MHAVLINTKFKIWIIISYRFTYYLLTSVGTYMSTFNSTIIYRPCQFGGVTGLFVFSHKLF